MKKTFTINISSIVFHIDEDAYEKLQNYLSSISGHFSNEEEGKEIIVDIETRIAELFQAKVGTAKQVITIGDVDEMIKIMGQPEDFSDGEQKSEKKKETPGDKSKPHKRIHRDPDNRVLGGVCSGLGAYFNIDPVIVRIIAIITFFAFGPLVYIVLWIAIPKAQTTAQKLEMRGEKVNISNIERSIKEEFHDVKENFKKFRQSDHYHDSRNVFYKIIHLIGVIISGIAKIIVTVIGFALVIAGLALLFGLSGSFVFDNWGVNNISLPAFFTLFTDPSKVILISIGIFLLIGIPVLSIIYCGIRMLFRIKANNKIIGISATLLWLSGLVLLLAVFFMEIKNFSATNTAIETSTFSTIKSDTLYLKMSAGNPAYDDNDLCIHLHDVKVVADNNTGMIIGRPHVDIEKCEGDKFELVVRRISNGENKKDAMNHAEKISYNWKQTDSLIVFDSHFNLPENYKWRDQQVETILKVPVGKFVFIDKSMNDIIFNIENTSDMADEDMIGKMWVMKPEGLTPAQHCEP